MNLYFNCKYIAVIILFIFLTLSTVENSFSIDGRVWHIEDKNKDTIDFGIVFLGDSVGENFLLQNYTNKSYKVLGKSPSYIIKAVKGGDLRYLHFIPEGNSNPILEIKPNSEPDSVVIYFRDKLNNDDATGLMEAIFELGMVDDSFPESDPRHLIAADTFLLRGIKTNKLIAAYEEHISFDSVYIREANQPSEKVWNLRNVWRERLKIESDFYELKTSKIGDGEISFETINVPYELKARSEYFKYPARYKPLDFYGDTAFYKMYYYTDIDETNPNRKFDSVVTLITGVGVKQDLRINSINYGNSFAKSTDLNEPNTWIIELGNLTLDKEQLVSVIVQNPITTSNIPIGKSSEIFTQKFNRSDDISLSKAFISDGVYLTAGSLDTITFKIKPTTIGSFEFEYKLTTNLKNRKIYNYQNQDEVFKFIFKGVGSAAQIGISKDTINFGSINIVGNCPLSLTDSIAIFNRGTSDMDIKFIPLSNFDGFNFDNSGISTIKPSEKLDLKLSFSPLNEVNYSSILGIIYNIGNKEDTVRINLFGTGISKLSTQISINNYTFKPGSELNIPILTEGNKINLASKFSTTLRYNNTLLKYLGYKSANTASQNLSLDSKVAEKNNININELNLYLNTTQNTNFLNSDTLIILRFNTFLGDVLDTEIEIFEPKIGNDNCPEIIEITKQNGNISIDSICGLEYKVFDRSERQKFVLNYPTPNPVNDKVKFDFTVAYRTNINIEIYNSYGENIYTIINQELEKGNYSKSLDIAGFNSGLYLIRMKAGLFESSKTFIKE